VPETDGDALGDWLLPAPLIDPEVPEPDVLGDADGDSPLAMPATCIAC
jgi:hypothetical protein